MELVFLQGAEADIQTAFEFYGESEAARAARFLQHLDKVAGLLRENPAMGPIYERPFRRLILRGFHHAMFYTVEGRRIFVSALLDLRSDPTRIRQRLGLDEAAH